MSLACLIPAVCVAIASAAVWLVSGGSALSALWVYVLTGQSAILCMLGRVVLRSRQQPVHRTA